MTNKISGISFFLAIVSAFLLTACDAGKNDQGFEYAPNMYHAVPYEPLKQVTDEDAGKWVNSSEDDIGEYYSSNPNNPYGMNMREPVANTVRRNDYLPNRIPKDSFAMAERLLKNPLDSTAEVVAQGKVLYLRFCSHCHGEDGLEPGKVGEVYAGVTSYASAAVKDKGEGHIFHVITHGKGRMWPQASLISQEDRWKIVKYVQVLQRQ